MILEKDYIDTIGWYKFKYNQATIRDVLEYDDYIINQDHSIIDWLLLFLENKYVKTKKIKKLDEDFKLRVILDWEKVFHHINEHFFIWVKFWKSEEKEQKKMDTSSILSALQGREKKVERADRPLIAILWMVANYWHVSKKELWDLSWEEVFDEDSWMFYGMIFNLNDETEEGRKYNLKKQEDKEFAKRKKQLKQDYKDLQKYKDANKGS